MSGAGESPRVPHDEAEKRSSGIVAKPDDMIDTAGVVSPAFKRPARLGGDGEPYPEDFGTPLRAITGLGLSTAEDRAKDAWPTIEQQTKCWPPKSKAEEERQVMSDALVTLALKAPAAEIDWTALSYRLARIPKAREAIFAAMDVEGRPWRWADTVVVAVVLLASMAVGAALLAVAAKIAS